MNNVSLYVYLNPLTQSTRLYIKISLSTIFLSAEFQTESKAYIIHIGTYTAWNWHNI